jgi:hypothetical protein
MSDGRAAVLLQAEVGVPHRVGLSSFVPFLACFVGLGVSILRFRADDPLGGLVGGLAGVVLMMAIAMRLPASE